MAKYVEGFVLVVPKAKRAEYRKLAKQASEIWKQFGAIDYVEARLDDEKPQHITFTFPKMTKAKEDEEVWFSYITYESKAARNKINKQVISYWEEKYTKEDMDKGMPFDMKRFAQGGFKIEVEG